jgi:hypothetical protein
MLYVFITLDNYVNFVIGLTLPKTSKSLIALELTFNADLKHSFKKMFKKI